MESAKAKAVGMVEFFSSYEQIIQQHSGRCVENAGAVDNKVTNCDAKWWNPHEPGSRLFILGMVILPLGNPSNRYVKPYYWVHGDHRSLDPSTNDVCIRTFLQSRA